MCRFKVRETAIAKLMKNALIICAFTFLSACTPVKVIFDQNVNFGEYRTFYCMECMDEYSSVAPEIDNANSREQIRSAIIQELNKRGLTYTEIEPQLLVDFKVVIEERRAFLGHPETTYNYWETYKFPEKKFRHRTLIINLIDAKSETAVWQGIAPGLLDDNPEEVNVKTRNLISKMFRKYNK